MQFEVRKQDIKDMLNKYIDHIDRCIDYYEMQMILFAIVSKMEYMEECVKAEIEVWNL